MTREEVIQGLQFTIEMFLFDPSTGETLTEPRNDMDKTTIDACKGAIELLKPQPKRGQWEVIRKEYEFMGGIVNEPQGCRCSNCGGIVKFKSDFCPNCGADMREIQDADRN